MRSLIAILCMLFSLSAVAQQFKATIDKKDLLIGDQRILTLTESTGTYDIDRQEITDRLSNAQIDVIDIGAVQREGDQPGWKLDLMITSFDSGVVWVPPLMAVRPETADTVYTRAIPLNVTLPVVDSTEITPIKHIIKESWNLQDATLVYVLIGLLLVSGILSYLNFKNYEGDKIEFTEVNISPFILANQRLVSLENQGLWQRGYLKKYYSEISYTLRQYVEQSLKIPALESTTSEIKSHLQNHGLKEEKKDRLIDLLSMCDRVKYASFEPPYGTHSKKIIEARSIVEGIENHLQSLKKIDLE